MKSITGPLLLIAFGLFLIIKMPGLVSSKGLLTVVIRVIGLIVLVWGCFNLYYAICSL